MFIVFELYLVFHILDLLCLATDMEISIQKYKWLFNELNLELIEVLCHLIPYPWGHLDNIWNI